jgi:site-specific recombinase XerD
MELRQRGVSPVSVKPWLRCMNAYFKWNGAGFKIGRLKEEQKVLATLTQDQVKHFIAFKPQGINETRAHMVALLILDGGYRISEVLALPSESCDFDNLSVKVKGKGGKHRLVPMSNDMRRVLFKYAAKRSGPGRVLFGTRTNSQVSVRNFERDLKLLGRSLNITGVRFSPHTMRHTFAVFYLRNGGNLFYLSKILGHSTVKTTERYLQSLQVTDLQAVHDRLSLLTPERVSFPDVDVDFCMHRRGEVIQHLLAMARAIRPSTPTWRRWGIAPLTKRSCNCCEMASHRFNTERTPCDEEERIMPAAIMSVAPCDERGYTKHDYAEVQRKSKERQ